MTTADQGVLPPPGDVFLVPITGTMNTFVWVTGPWVIEDNPYRRVLLACATWTGTGRPTKADLAARKVRELFDVKGKRFGPLVAFTHEAVSSKWQRIGRVSKPAVAQKPLPWSGSLDTIQLWVQRMWEAKHQPEKIAAELAEQAALEAEDATETRALAKLVAARKKGPLAKLAKLDLLPEWDGLTTRRRKTTVALWLQQCVVAMRALPRGAKRADKLAVIEATVERVNAWSCDAIDTPEREALCTALDDIGHAAGLRGHDLAGPYRDW